MSHILPEYFKGYTLIHIKTYILLSVVHVIDFDQESPKLFLAITWNIYMVSGTKLFTVYSRTDVETESGIDGDNVEGDDCDILQYCT